MEGKNKKIEQEIIPAASAWPKNSISARPFSSMSPSNLPLSPTSFNVARKPYFMNNQVGVGASSSGTKTCFFQRSDHFSMKGENNKTDQNPFPPSNDQNLTLETSGADNSAKTEVGNGVQVSGSRNLDNNMDPRKLKRVISNRISAQKSRIKKLQYVCDMERKAESLETLIAVLSSQVALQRDKKYLLQLEQKNLNQRISVCANHKLIVDAEIEERTAEVNRLRQLHLTQQHQNMQTQTRMAWEHGLAEQMVNPCLNQSGTGQTMYVNSNQVDAGEYTAEINRLNQLNLQHENPGHILVPGWEPGRGQLTNVGLVDQSGLGQVQNPSLNQSKQQQEGGFNSNLGGLEQILNINPENHINPRNDFI